MLQVLVVEDDSKFFEICKKALIDLGVGKIDYADSSEKALSYLENRSYDLILLDIELPGMSGIEFAKKIHLDARHRLQQIVFITGSEADWELQAFRELHCYDYIRKPVTVKALEKKLDLLIEGMEVQKRQLPQPTVPEKARRAVLFFSHAGGEQCVAVEEVLYAEATGGECVLYTISGPRHLSGISLKEAIVSLSAENAAFVQCHRAFAVDASKIQKIQKRNYRNYEVYLRGLEAPICMSGRYLNTVQNRWKEAGEY